MTMEEQSIPMTNHSRPAWRPFPAWLWAVAGPATLELAALRLSQVLDLFWLGRLGPAAVAAAGIGASLRWALASVVLGLSVGGMMLVARYTGEWDYKAAGDAARHAIVLCFSLTAALSAAGLAVAGPLLGWLGAGADVQPLALAYLRIALPGLIPLMLVLTASALWRSAGAVRLAGATLGLSLALSVLLEPFLVLGWGHWRGMGIAGAALAWALGPTVGAVAQLVLLRRGSGGLCLGHGASGISLKGLWCIVASSGSGSLQLAVGTLARVAVIGIIARYGGAVLAGYALANGILMLLLVPGCGLANVAAALVVRNLRAGRRREALRSAWAAGAIDAAYMVAMVAALFAVAPRAIAAFNSDPQVITHGANALRLIGLGYISSSIGVIIARGLDVAGHHVPVVATNLLTLWGIQVPLVSLLSHLMGPAGLWLGLAIGSVANGMFVSYRFRRGRWNLA